MILKQKMGEVNMDIGFYLTYLMIPIAISIVYWYANIKENKKSILMYNLIKGIVYFYLASALIFSENTERYVTGLTLFIAIIEGNSAIYLAITNHKKR